MLAGCAASTLDRPMAIEPSSRVSRPAPTPFAYPIVVETGSPTDLGSTHGEALRADVRYLHDAYLKKFVANKSQSALAGMMATMFRSYVAPEHLAEIDALAAATSIDEREVMLGQCFLDLTPMAACSTIALPASASVDGVPRMGRNLDFWSLNVADRYTKVFIIKPTDGRYGFASIGWPGMIGTLSGMNEFGLTLANMEVPRPVRFPQAMPYPLLYRSVLERCRTVPEAIAMLRRTPIQTANNLMLMDAAGNRAVAELVPPASVIVREGEPDHALLSTNHQRGSDQDSAGRCWRYDRMHHDAQCNYGQFDTQKVEQMMSTVGGEITLQSMVFEPTRRRIFIAAGRSACTRPYSTLDLNDFFGVASASTDDAGFSFAASH